VDPRTGLDDLEKRKFVPLPGLEHLMGIATLIKEMSGKITSLLIDSTPALIK
jgi:hypothetical protein